MMGVADEVRYVCMIQPSVIGTDVGLESLKCKISLLKISKPVIGHRNAEIIILTLFTLGTPD